MQECAAVGVTPLEFWDLTYREAYNALAGDAIRRRRDRQAAMWAAWHTGAFARSTGKRLPDLSAILRKMEPMREMTNQQMRSFVLGLAKTMGAKVRHVKRGEL